MKLMTAIALVLVAVLAPLSAYADRKDDVQAPYADRTDEIQAP